MHKFRHAPDADGGQPVGAVWTEGKVPNGYWDTRHNRIAYLRWLGNRLGYQKPDDWYAITRRHFQENHGGGLLHGTYNDSPIAAMQDMMPRRRWLPWLFRRTSQGFWRQVDNRRAFIAWFEKRRGIQSKEDWYQVSKQDFVDDHGAGLLSNYYGDSVLAAARERHPRTLWQEWRFEMVPQGFWKCSDNFQRYMDWLSEELKIRTPHLWYGVGAKAVRQHHGSTPLAMYGDSVYELVRAYLPSIDWKPWLFGTAPNGFWQQPKNRHSYLVWLGNEIGFRRPSDWYEIKDFHFKRTGGAALFDMYYRNSRMRAAEERYPDYRWNVGRFKDATNAVRQANSRNNQRAK